MGATAPSMRVFLAGATGVIGRELVPLLLAAGHQVAGMTRSPDKLDRLGREGAQPVLCDVYDLAALKQAVTDFRPDVVMHQLTDLPDTVEHIADYTDRNNRIRMEGTRNLLGAARTAGARRFIAQSIAWTPPGAGEAVAQHEQMVLDAGGVVLRYGMFYGPGTYSGTDRLPPSPRVHVSEAARRTVAALDAATGIVVIVDPDGPLG